MKDIELKLISELVKNSRRSYREFAKALGVSQPTVSRMRVRVEKQGLIDYNAVPNRAKLGFETIAVSFGSEASRSILKSISKKPKTSQKDILASFLVLLALG